MRCLAHLHWQPRVIFDEDSVNLNRDEADSHYAASVAAACSDRKVARRKQLPAAKDAPSYHPTAIYPATPG